MKNKETGSEGYFLAAGQAVVSWLSNVGRKLFPEESPADSITTDDPYVVAEAEFIARLKALQEMGRLRRPSQITDEYEQDDHFDDLMRLYRQVCWEMGLDWPPLEKLDTEEFPMDPDCE